MKSSFTGSYFGSSARVSDRYVRPNGDTIRDVCPANVFVNPRPAASGNSGDNSRQDQNGANDASGPSPIVIAPQPSPSSSSSSSSSSGNWARPPRMHLQLLPAPPAPPPNAHSHPPPNAHSHHMSSYLRYKRSLLAFTRHHHTFYSPSPLINYNQNSLDGPRVLFVAKVLVGNYTMGHTQTRRPPLGFDSCVDNPMNPGMFVIFDRNQVYPAYMIEYRLLQQ